MRLNKQTLQLLRIIDKKSDIINKSLLSTVLRYTDKNNEVQEIFIDFTDVSRDRKASVLFKHVNKVFKSTTVRTRLWHRHMMVQLSWPVSYTHLDVYKRQCQKCSLNVCSWRRIVNMLQSELLIVGSFNGLNHLYYVVYCSFSPLSQSIS